MRQRFDLRRRFDHIQIGEEASFGKPDGRAYVDTLAALEVEPANATMIGDDLVWDVLAPKRLGMTGIWCNRFAAAPSLAMPVIPDRTVNTLAELLGRS